MAATINNPIMTERAVEGAISRFVQARATGRRLAWMREAANVSQAELAAYLGVSRGTIYNLEHGRRAMRPAERAAIARALGTSIATLTVAAYGSAARAARGTRERGTR